MEKLIKYGGKYLNKAQIAAMSRQFTVSNNVIPNSKNTVIVSRDYNNPFQMDKKELEKFHKENAGKNIYYRTSWDISGSMAQAIKPGKLFKYNIKENKHGLHLELLPDVEYENIPYPQQKRLIKCKKKKRSKNGPIVREKRNDFAQFNYTVPKMNKVEYMEKLSMHKLAKWEQKNPAPIPPKKDPQHPDLFNAEDTAKYQTEKKIWEEKRDLALERIRDFVVSVYDKLPVLGNRVDYKNGQIKSTVVDTVKDVDGKGHNVGHPNLTEKDRLYIDATKKAQKAMDKDTTIIDADLMNHKRNQKRPLNVNRKSKTVTLGDHRKKKAA